MAPAKIIIIGAGMGGLTAALALQKAGYKVEIYEQAPELTELGAGLTLSPNGTRILIELGLGDWLEATAFKPERGLIREGSTGRVLLQTYEGDSLERMHGAPYCFVHRADLHGALLGHVRARDPNAVFVDHTFAGYEQSASGVKVLFENQPSVHADGLVGADGMKSKVRECLLGPQPVEFQGNVAWRGLVPMDTIPSDIPLNNSTLWIGGGRHVTHYPIRGGKILNFVAATETADWVEESWTVPSTVSEIEETFADWPDHVRTIISLTPPELCFKWALFDREPLSKWTEGNVTLLGDAAHPMLPFLGQGAAMAIEDAMVLSRALSASDDLEAGFAAYERARRDRTDRTFYESREAGVRFHKDVFTKSSLAPDQAMRTGELFGYNAITAEL